MEYRDEGEGVRSLFCALIYIAVSISDSVTSKGRMISE
jgi:hypothetical protein